MSSRVLCECWTRIHFQSQTADAQSRLCCENTTFSSAPPAPPLSLPSLRYPISPFLSLPHPISSGTPSASLYLALNTSRQPIGR